jgi:Flp pilus assembly protein TadD
MIALLRLIAIGAVAISAAAQARPADDMPLIAAAIRSGRLVQAELMLARMTPPAGEATTELEILRSQLALAQGRDHDARRDFAALARRMPDDCRVLLGLGMAESDLGDADLAIGHLERATRTCVADWKVWSALGFAYDAKARWGDSDAAYAQAMASGGDRPALLNNVAASRIKQRRFAEAEPILARARAKAPDDILIANNLDIAAGSLGRMPVRGPRDSTSRWAERLNNAGYAAMLAGRADDARKWLTMAVAADPVFQAIAAANLARLDARK